MLGNNNIRKAESCRRPRATEKEMGAKGIDMEALSPRDANAQRLPRATELKTKAAAQLKATKDKEHPPPPPNNVNEPPSSDRKDGAVYQVGKPLGKGGFAICYEGKLAGTSKRYALKIVKSHMPAKMEQKFQTELQIHSKMRQQNIVQFHRAFTFEKCTFLVLELCPNGSLMDMVKRRKGLTEPEVRYYSVQIAGAIKYMHAKGIIHRDLKMGNIFLDKYMNAKIGDFGLAALLLTGKDMQIMRRTTLCGTPNYIAPEILEKDKKGHDHMVDIWSLGIIVFAMLTSKPPFQSSTTDEIYRRAKNRDYEWPSPETSQKYISQEAKDLVATMLEDADRRPDPDTIVEHPFFSSGYMPLPSDLTIKLREFPPENPVFYERFTSAQAEARNLRNLQEMCRECGVGPWSQSQLAFKNIWREMAEEEQNGLTPVIPLAEGIVYRPYDEIKAEYKARVQARMAAQQAQQQFSKLSERTDELSSQAESSSSQKAPSGLLRAPPQSFAAQQRAQSRPANTGGLARSQSVAEPATRTAGSVRLRSQREAPATGRQSPDELAAAPTVSRGTTRTLRNQLPSSRTQAALTREEQVSQRTQASTTVSTKREQSREEKLSLFAPSECQETVPGTRPDVVLDRLRKLQAELERALNARSMAILSSKDKTPSPPHIVVKWVDYTNKFGLGYILNDGSVGCILRNIPTQDASNKTGMLPPACMLVHGAERHCQRREDPRYLDRHQIVPMTEGIYFYENNAEDGFSRVRVAPETFSIPMNSDGTAGKLSAGKDIYDHRKRERIVLWKKFANYMIAYGREMEGPAQQEESPIRMPTITDPTAAPSDVVTFYQRFGDVGCWMFCDGHMQFNFPDHTKIVLDATGTWCHFWHLPQDAARRLQETGSLAESALDDRTVLSYPLQTLLNFSAKSSTTRVVSNGRSGRYRPEISPELQGIPAANHFRRKVEFIRDVIREWNSNGGIGNSDMSREKRLRWTGMRETQNVPIPAKHVWVTIGARWGDERLSAYVDPRKPAEMGPDIDESKKRSP
ncbi:cell cycle serine/threonine-protein kinase CDC5/MSD2 [Diplogelasinospora grovesii]|uniref:Cell cycle serine/threonine-protein kinase CDC5/MSD2 n=1 Tax=Diplogelasinospora grovesii TaxID=303347 RepID=A0AAN6S4C7_9PEZI|nr:cell cycle serine/threonine-protein kinase CDC5/MSD2 [Diplogelasinospora grovesii]